MILEEQRFLHEDLERLEQGIADRVVEDPKQVRERLNRDHQIGNFLDRIQDQSKRLLDIYKDVDGVRSKEIQSISTGEPLEEFYKQLGEIRSFHQRYPNEPVENLEKAYKKKAPAEGEIAISEIDNMFTGEEAFGRFLDLTTIHELFLNLPNIKRLSYLQYLDNFDSFAPPTCPVKRPDKMTDQYFSYRSYSREIEEDFEKAWKDNDVPGWKLEITAPVNGSSNSGIWCADCEKEFKNENVYKGHLPGKKHIRAAEARATRLAETGEDSNGANGAVQPASSTSRLKERAIAEREYRVRRLAAAMTQERSDTRVNVERKQGMTERERQMELDSLFAESSSSAPRDGDSDSESDGDDKIYNPLKLPLAWDGKPIPFWLYKLHGLGVEFKLLGYHKYNTIPRDHGIEDALKLWDKLQREKKKGKTEETGVVQMEDAEGNVMPEKVYYDLQKQGLL
ncbi:hypothetical protein DID88_004774 [Monilinia fructigena]|uniref:C2H2-type domain-containing protein n=1 Tax=Monilinia fructigena TaxID=38457 RepID=A0A395IU46_9HELO|nr:hypothetical protein DID88_004774 [Monilinia fructigena]